DLHLDKKVQLGDPVIDNQVNALLLRLREDCKHVYVLRWEGNKIPRGAVLGEETIAWTQNGCVNSKSGKMIGTYCRVVEFGGQSGKEQVMLVYTP
ncbi:hypothetical protein KA107_03490, partial [Candidatus Pacearchaeota archaeon]|nr:hypothetical protein [Candidatus Pacearchaeota archaeon]